MAASREWQKALPRLLLALGFGVTAAVAYIYLRIAADRVALKTDGGDTVCHAVQALRYPVGLGGTD